MIDVELLGFIYHWGLDVNSITAVGESSLSCGIGNDVGSRPQGIGVVLGGNRKTVLWYQVVVIVTGGGRIVRFGISPLAGFLWMDVLVDLQNCLQPRC